MPGPAESTVTTPAPPPASSRQAMRLVTTAWIFGASWMYITTGAAFTRFAQLLGVRDEYFGLITALPFLAALSQLPISFIVERYGHHKPIFLAIHLVHRGTWLAIAAIPWLFPEASWWLWFLGLLMVTHVAGQMAIPLWISWMGETIPSRIRGRYFSRRNQVGMLIGAMATLAVGYAMDAADATESVTLMRTISVLFGIAAVAGCLDSLFHFKVPPPREHRPNRQLSLWAMIKPPLQDRNFRLYLGFASTLTFSIGYVGQYVWLYLFDVVGMNNKQANSMLVTIPLLLTMISYPAWGRLIDRFGRKPILLIAGLLIVHGGAAWVFITPESWWLGYLAAMSATLAWPGVELANFNLLLQMSESRTDGHLHPQRGASSAYVAVNSLAIAVAGTCSGLFGSAIAGLLGDWEGTLFGWPLTYHGVLLLSSAALRFAALGWLIKLEDPKAQPTRGALRYMATNIYSNVQQALFMPTRRLFRLGRWAYKLSDRQRPHIRP